MLRKCIKRYVGFSILVKKMKYILSGQYWHHNFEFWASLANKHKQIFKNMTQHTQVQAKITGNRRQLCLPP